MTFHIDTLGWIHHAHPEALNWAGQPRTTIIATTAPIGRAWTALFVLYRVLSLSEVALTPTPVVTAGYKHKNQVRHMSCCEQIL